MLRYLQKLPLGKTMLWCYLIWYLCTVYFHFDPSINLWLNSLGICLVIGFALQLSVAKQHKTDHWQTFRLFAMPFCVSSFSSLIKGKGFWLIFSSNPKELLITTFACCGFLALVYAVKKFMP